MQIGDTIYEYNSIGRGDYRSKWIPQQIVSETKRTVTTSARHKIDKKTKRALGPYGGNYRFMFSEQELEDHIWKVENSHRLINLLIEAPAEVQKKVDLLLKELTHG